MKRKDHLTTCARHLALAGIWLTASGGVGLLSSCSATKYLSDGDFLLSSVDVKVDSIPGQKLIGSSNKILLDEDLMPLISQKTTTKWLGIFDLSSFFYNLPAKDANGWWARHIRRLGQKPVVFSLEETNRSAESLNNFFVDKGYLRSATSVDIDTISSKKMKVSYRITSGPLYQIGKSDSRIEDARIANTLSDTTTNKKHAYSGESFTSLVKEGMPLSSYNMRSEQGRIVTILKNRGYYDFSEEQIRFEIDTISNVKDAWVRMVIDSGAKVYRIGKIRVLQEPANLSETVKDSVYTSQVRFYYPKKGRLSPNFVLHRIGLASDSLFRLEEIRQTHRALNSLSAIRSVGIEHRIDTSDMDDPRIDADIYLNLNRGKEVTFDLEATYSSGYWGGKTALAWVHNNLFSRSERLKVEARLGYEVLTRRNNFLYYGGGVELSLPKLFLPFFKNKNYRFYRSTTDLRLDYDHLERPEFSRHTFSASWGYNWLNFRYPSHRHSVKMLEVDYMNYAYIDEAFRNSIPDITQMLYYRNQFIVGASYTYTYNSALDPKRSTSAFQNALLLYLQSAGNMLYALSSLANQTPDERGAYTLLKTNFAQFVRGELDYRGKYSLSGKNTLAYRFGANVLVPYKNSIILPIDYRYYSGGAYSLRGWKARELGPGSMPRGANATIYSQVGDVKLDLGLEYRGRISSAWELAFFLDAGNIWTIREYDYQPDGVFRFDRFYKEIALSTGLGLRFDFNSFIIRADLGVRLHDPQLDPKDRWIIARTQALKDVATLNIAIGYPF